MTPWLLRFGLGMYKKIAPNIIWEDRSEARQEKSVDWLMQLKRRAAFVSVNEKIETVEHFSVLHWKSITSPAKYKSPLKRAPKVIFYGHCNIEPQHKIINHKQNEYRTIKEKFNFRMTLKRLSAEDKLHKYAMVTPSGGWIISEATTSDEVLLLLQTIANFKCDNILKDGWKLDSILHKSGEILYVCHENCKGCGIFSNSKVCPEIMNNANLFLNKINKYKTQNTNIELIMSPIKFFSPIRQWVALSKIRLRKKLPTIEYATEYRQTKLNERKNSQKKEIEKLKRNKRRGDIVGKAKMKLYYMNKISDKIQNDNLQDSEDDNEVDMDIDTDEPNVQISYDSSTQSADLFFFED
eukprot:204998_1